MTDGQKNRRTGKPASSALDLLEADHRAVEKLFAAKYFNLDEMFYDKRHAWMCVTPSKISSWDFRKLASL